MLSLKRPTDRLTELALLLGVRVEPVVGALLFNLYLLLWQMKVKLVEYLFQKLGPLTRVYLPKNN